MRRMMSCVPILIVSLSGCASCNCTQVSDEATPASNDHSDIRFGMSVAEFKAAGTPPVSNQASNSKVLGSGKHLFTIEIEDAVVTYLAASVLPRGYYFVFRNDALDQISPPEPIPLRTRTNPQGKASKVPALVACRSSVEWVKTARHMSVEEMLDDARQAAARDAAARERCSEFNPVHIFGLLVPDKPDRQDEGKKERYLKLREKCDALRIDIGSSQSDIEPRLGAPLSSKAMPDGRGKIVVYGEDEADDADFKRLLVIVFCDDRASQIYSDYNRSLGFSQAESLQHIFSQTFQCDASP